MNKQITSRNKARDRMPCKVMHPTRCHELPHARVYKWMTCASLLPSQKPLKVLRLTRLPLFPSLPEFITIERFGYEEARRLAIEFRYEWEQAIKTGQEKVLEEFFEAYHYSRLIENGIGLEEWATFGEELLELQARV